jgi:hypothetical protein
MLKRYSDYITVDEMFQSSVNLVFDFNSPKKLESYIPTAQSVRIIDRYLRTIYYQSTQRSSVLIGPYGRGKSHLMLVLLALISLEPSKPNENELLQKLIAKIKSVSKETGKLAEEVAFHKKRILPVIINSNGGDVSQAFTIAIRDALHRAHEDELLPKTYFDVALNTILNWEANYKVALDGLGKELEKVNYSVKQMKQDLYECKQDAYREFCEVYPKIALGAPFNPLVNVDIVNLYQAANEALCDKGKYDGIFVVFDEFSKYMEAHLDAKDMMDFKAIQDFAEMAQRSGEKQFHLVCVTHKEILDYSKSDTFKTVAGRFESVRFVASSEQSYELIANTLLKKSEYGAFQKKYKGEFQRALQQAPATGLFNDIPNDVYEQILVYGCFPLAPITSYCLLRVSEKVAQNERTMFTFISQNDKNTVYSFLNHQTDDKCKFITVDGIYDYFEDLFRKEIFNERVHTAWAKADDALRRIDDSSKQKKIIKAMAVFQIVNDGKLIANPALIKSSLLMKDSDFDTAVDAMVREHLVGQKDNGEYILLTANGVDVRKSVGNTIAAKPLHVDRADILNAIQVEDIVLPREYNDQYSMLRYYKVVYMNADSFIKVRSAQQLLLKNGADGLIVNVIYDTDEEKQNAISHLCLFEGHPEVVACIPTKLLIDKSLFEQYEAIGLVNKSSKVEDAHFREELGYYQTDVIDTLSLMCKNSFAAESRNSKFFNCDGEMLGIQKQVQLVRQLSAICMKRYNATPIVKNEMINRQNLSAPLQRARVMTIQWLFDHASDKSIPAMAGLGPEVSVFRTTIVRKGLDKNSRSDDRSLNEVLEIARKFFITCESSPKSMGEIYNKLTSGAIAMRRGPIPIYLAYVLKDYQDDVVLYYNGKEVPFEAKIFTRIDENPDDFKIFLEKGTKEKESYLSELETLFANYSSTDMSSSRVYTLVGRMQTWMRSLPKYSREYSKSCSDSGELEVNVELSNLRRELLRFNVNPRELLFVTIPQKIYANNDLNECVRKVREGKKQLDAHMDIVRADLIKKVRSLFEPEYHGGLSEALSQWYAGLDESCKNHLFDRLPNTLLEFAADNDSNDDQSILDHIIGLVTPLALSDWNDEIAMEFVQSLSQAIETINKFKSNMIPKDDKQDGTIKCQLTIEDNNKTLRRGFSSAALSPMAENAYNVLKNDMETMGDAVEEEEKLAILAKLIREMI